MVQTRWGRIARLFAPFGDPDVIFTPESIWPMWLRHAGIHGSLILEASIPILLAIPRTCLLGFLAGFALHFFLGVCFFWHFTPMLWAVFVLFAPPVVIERVAGVTASALSRLREGVARFGVPLTPASALALSALRTPAAAQPTPTTKNARPARPGKARWRWSWQTRACPEKLSQTPSVFKNG
jgi:hypothetical protein